jgi:hypothetical protein
MLHNKSFNDILVFIGVKKQMAKFKTLVEEETTELPEGINTVEAAEVPKFTRYMVGTYLDPISREWMLAYAHFDPSTGIVDKMQTERVAGNHEVMVERFQIKVGNLGLMTTEDVQQEKKVEIY